MRVCVGGETSSPPEGASNLQPVLHHASEVSAPVFNRFTRLEKDFSEKFKENSKY